MDDHRLHEAARRAADYAHEQYGNWFIDATHSNPENSPNPDRWPDFFKLLLQYTTRLNPLCGLWEECALDSWYTERLSDEVNHMIDPNRIFNSFEDDVATSPRSPSASLCGQSSPESPSPTARPYSLNFGHETEDQVTCSRAESGLCLSRAPSARNADALTTHASVSVALNALAESSSSRRSLHEHLASSSCAASTAVKVRKKPSGLLRAGQKRRADKQQAVDTASRTRMGQRGGCSRKCRVRDDQSEQRHRVQAFVDDIGSEASLSRLQYTLHEARNACTPNLEIQSGRSASEIFHAMDRRDEMIQLQILQQGLDAVELYERLRYEISGQSSERFHLLTSETFERSVRPRDGNPRFRDKADIVARLVQEVAPSLDKKSSEYKRIKAKAKGFRECGSRLALIAEKFGRSMIPLVLLSGEGEWYTTHWRRHMSVSLKSFSRSQADQFKRLRHIAVGSQRDVETDRLGVWGPPSYLE